MSDVTANIAIGAETKEAEPAQGGRANPFLLVPITLFFGLLGLAVLRSPSLMTSNGIGSAIIVATPRIPATDDLIGARQFKVMRPGMVLIDVGRGGVVNQNAMLDALRRGRLAAAGLDVFATEPLPPASPLWTMPNVIVTPHISAASPHYWEHAVEVIATNLNRMLSGEPMIDEITHEWLDQLKPRKSEAASR